MSEQSPLLSQESLGFDPENLRAKYVEEREKRIREDAESQFVAVGHDSPFANKYLQDDPYAQAETREPIVDERDVVVVNRVVVSALQDPSDPRPVERRPPELVRRQRRDPWKA